MKKFWKTPLFIITSILLTKIFLLRLYLFEQISIQGIFFDLSSILFLAGFIELFVPKTMNKTVYWMINMLFSIIFFAATVYFEHFGSIITYTSLFQIKQLGQISDSIKTTIQWNDFLFFTDFFVPIVWMLWTKNRNTSFFRSKPFAKKTTIVLVVVCLSFSILSYKMDKTLTNELVSAEQLGLFNYEVNTILSRNKKDFTNMQQTVLAIAETQKENQNANQKKLFGTQKGKNLIMIQLEAFQNFPINLSIQGIELTPNLNKLAKEGYYFPNVFQQIGQGNTSDAEFMSNTSIYPTGTMPMSTGYGDRNLPSLPKLLEARGYEADTFHVNDVTFWDRNKLYPALGFTHYYDKPFYTNDNFNTLGASDEELYRVGLEKITALQKQNKPFYAQFITLSSHHPFKIPTEKQNTALRNILTRSQLGDYLLAINYTDKVLGQFINNLKTSGLWDNSVLVAYGDHYGLQPKDNKPEEILKITGVKYHPDITRFNIPLFIHVPNLKSGQTIAQVGGQMDIMPTVANLLGISLKDEAFVHFGQDLFNINKNVFGMRYYMPSGSFFNNEIMFVPGKGFEDGTATSLKTLEPVKDFSKYKADYDYVLNQMQLSDNYVNLLPKR